MAKQSPVKECIDIDDVTIAGSFVRRFQILLYEADPVKLRAFIEDVIDEMIDATGDTVTTSEGESDAYDYDDCDIDSDSYGGGSSDSVLESVLPYLSTLSRDPCLPTWLRFRLHHARSFTRVQDRSVRFTLLNIHQYMRANGWLHPNGGPSVTVDELAQVISNRKR